MLCTEEYKQQLEHIHKTTSWGGGVATKVKYIVPNAIEKSAKTILDYGCGSGTFKKVCNEDFPDMDVREYDPGILEKSSLPTPADYIVSVDVLEHIEPELVDSVLQHIQSLMLKGGFLCICLVPAFLILPDGRNAHLTIRSAGWWQSKLDQYFTTDSVVYKTKGHLAVFVKPK